MATPREQLADLLKQARLAAGYASHGALAKKLNISRSVIRSRRTGAALMSATLPGVTPVTSRWRQRRGACSWPASRTGSVRQPARAGSLESARFYAPAGSDPAKGEAGMVAGGAFGLGIADRYGSAPASPAGLGLVVLVAVVVVVIVLSKRGR